MNTRSRRILRTSAVTVTVTLIFCCIFTAIRFNDFWRYTSQSGLSPFEAIKVFGWPDEQREWEMSLSNAAADENWNRLDRLTRKDRQMEIGSYYRNLAKAMKGDLSSTLLDYYAPFERALFLPVGKATGRVGVAQSGDVWYELGELTMAEHSAMLGLIFSKNKKGYRFLHRLGEINHIWGEEQLAEKYFHLAGKGSRLSEEELQRRRSLLARRDIIHSATNYRSALKSLVEANKQNKAAYEYLICLDLLCKNLDAFAQDFDPEMPLAPIYRQAALLWMASEGDRSKETAKRFGITRDIFREYQEFISMIGKSEFQEIKERFGNTYWFYFNYARKNEN